MENASKALIIAGAILISILIISLGVIIYQQAAGVVNNNSMDELEVTQFNSKFTEYCGDNVKGATVQALINSIKTNNSSQDDGSKRIRISYNDNNTKPTAKTSKGDQSDQKTQEQISALTSEANGKIKTGSTYYVTVTQYTTAGLISEITISKRK